jgi:hypothetical protein
VLFRHQKTARDSCGSSSRRLCFHSAYCLYSQSGHPAGLRCVLGFTCWSCVQLDYDVSLASHVGLVSSSCDAALWQIRSIESALSSQALLTIFQALVVSRIDYCNFLRWLQNCQQAVLNSAARQIYSFRRHGHITPILRELHWLRIPERIIFKLGTLVYRCIEGTAPPYLSKQLQRSTSVTAGSRLRSASTVEVVVPASHRSTLGDRSFSVAGQRAWNSLPAHVRSSSSLSAFQRELKNFSSRAPSDILHHI